MKLLLLLNPAPTPQAHHQPRLCRLLILFLLLLRTAMWIHPAPSSTGGHASPSLLRYRCCCCCWVNNAASYVHVCTISFTWSTLDHFGDPLAHSFNVSHLISFTTTLDHSATYLSLSLIIFHLVLQSTDCLFVMTGMAYTLASWRNNSPPPPPEWLNP